ncbi:PREDICTED: CSC1-like protein RXW8 isoform X2 [Tarenaya hassleriana]|uniref:CSC1-like protein RXW8 isoform X2 n=1 Tax=Tarenaya hassleriana TaxID=28532 RepID=UPI00053C26AF|nr:PREDICTED: CSC1-like protein RXW8 isoform X2 [Tarenaya hassleriana]
MNISALLTSAGINIAICVVLLSLYSILRKQPSNYCVYFGRRLANGRVKRYDPFWYERFVPSPSWLVRAWETNEDELLAAAGLDAVVFLRMVVFSIRLFFIAAVVCIGLVLPVNYYGQQMEHKEIHMESSDVFTIENIKESSKWLWAHCVALYVITFAACILLYFEYKTIAKMRLAYITGSASKPSHFTVLIRGIPFSPGGSYSETVTKFFTNYYASSYLSHQMVYHNGIIQRLLRDAEKMCQAIKHVSPDVSCKPGLTSCTFCGGPTPTGSFHILASEMDSVKRMELGELSLTTAEQERPVAFVFFKTRYDALVVSEVLQASNPMLWVADLAPDPHDVYWRNLRLPYRQLWIRKIATFVGAIAFMFVFLLPVAVIQGLTQLDQLSHAFPFLRGILKKKFMNQVITGYLPSVILILFLYAVPPTMMYFSTLEGCVSRSRRKRSACIKVLYFTIWNVFFVNILSGSIIRQLSVFSSVRDLPAQLAKAVPTQASFFMTYVFTSGWASLACEIVQPMALIWNLVAKLIVKNQDDSYVTLRFPYHTEIPRLLLFGLLGFTNSVLAPLILPFLLIYFSFAYLIYKNQILNVYITKYESGGQYWPIFHSTTIFSLILTQIIALGFFGLKLSTVASGFTIPLILLTLLFSEYCRQRFLPIFKKHSAQVLIDMDREDEQSGKMEERHKNLRTAYFQIQVPSQESSKAGTPCSDLESQDPEKSNQDGEDESVKGKELWNFQSSEEKEEESGQGADEVKPCSSVSPKLIELLDRT